MKQCLWWIGENKKKSNMSEHDCSGNRKKRDAACLESEQNLPLCQRRGEIFMETKQWCQAKTKIAFMCFVALNRRGLIVC